MALHTDLVSQALQLATNEPRRPRQASLRRAVSAAYYALFHLLTDQASRLLVSGGPAHRKELRNRVRRAFSHDQMEQMCQQVVRGSSKWLEAANVNASSVLLSIAQAFVDLKQERHEADYNHSREFRRSEVLAVVRQAETAIQDWAGVKGAPEGDAFLIGLLLKYRS